MDQIILIGGAPTVGKSYLAERLAQDLKLPWMSTDIIREWMRELITHREEFPNLFDFDHREHADPVEYLTTRTAQEIVDHQNLESVQTWKGVEALVKKNYVWDSFIIEGVAILPQFAADLAKRNPRVKPVFLLDHDADRLREVIYTRGLWDDADKYPDTVKDKELAWVMLFNSWIERECKKVGLPTIEVQRGDSYIEEVKRIIHET